MATGVVLYGGCLLYFCRELYAPNISGLNFLAPALLLSILLLSGKFDKRKWLPLLAVLILVLDVLLLRMHVIHFYDRQVLDQPETVRTFFTRSEPK